MFLHIFPYCLKRPCFNLEELLLAIATCHHGITLHVHRESEFSYFVLGVSCSSFFLCLFTGSEDRQEYLKGKREEISMLGFCPQNKLNLVIY